MLDIQIPCSQCAACYAAEFAGYAISCSLPLSLDQFVITGYIASGYSAYKYPIAEYAAGYIWVGCGIDSLQFTIKFLKLKGIMQSEAVHVSTLCLSCRCTIEYLFVIAGYTAVRNSPSN